MKIKKHVHIYLFIKRTKTTKKFIFSFQIGYITGYFKEGIINHLQNQCFIICFRMQ